MNDNNIFGQEDVGLNQNPTNEFMNNQGGMQSGSNPIPVNNGMNNSNMVQPGVNQAPTNYGIDNQNNSQDSKKTGKKRSGIILGVVGAIILIVIIAKLTGGTSTSKFSDALKYLPGNTSDYELICTANGQKTETTKTELVAGVKKEKGDSIEYYSIYMQSVTSRLDGSAIEENDENIAKIEKNKEKYGENASIKFEDGKLIVSYVTAASSSRNLSDLKKEFASEGFSCK